MNEQVNNDSRPASISGDGLILAIGVLSGLLPLGLYFFPWTEHHASISAYFYSTANPIFVGILSAIGFVMLFYRGYGKNEGPIPLTDDQMATLVGISALMTAFFPTYTCGIESTPLYNEAYSPRANIIHYIAAGMTFASMGVFLLFYFTQTGGVAFKDLSPNKRIRNMVYRICGVVVFLSLFVMIIIIIKQGGGGAKSCGQTETNQLFFWVESIALFALSVGWLTKFAGRKLN